MHLIYALNIYVNVYICIGPGLVPCTVLFVHMRYYYPCARDLLVI